LVYPVSASSELPASLVSFHTKNEHQQAQDKAVTKSPGPSVSELASNQQHPFARTVPNYGSY
jgi:hypothetical protein